MMHSDDTPGRTPEPGPADSPAASSAKPASRRGSHLRQFQYRSGESGNPGGRPRKHPISEPLTELCNQPLPDEIARAAGLEHGAAWGALIAKNLMQKAARGDLRAIKEVFDRVEGGALHRQEVTGADGAPLVDPDSPEGYRARLARLIGVDYQGAHG